MGTTNNDLVLTQSAQPSVAEATVCCRAKGIRGDAIAVVRRLSSKCDKNHAKDF